MDKDPPGFSGGERRRKACHRPRDRVQPQPTLHGRETDSSLQLRKMVPRIGAVCQRAIGWVFKHLSKAAVLLVSHLLQQPNRLRTVITCRAAADFC
jgi:hypothetical protein